MNLTSIEKIISAHSGKIVHAGDKAVCKVDYCYSTDADAIDIILRDELYGNRLKFKKYGLFIDHYSPSPDVVPSAAHAAMRKFSKDNKIRLFDIGCGVSTQVLVEEKIVGPGDLIVSTDRQVPTVGGVNAAGVRISSDELIRILTTGQFQIVVPNTVFINIKGKLQPRVSFKDLSLTLLTGDIAGKIFGNALEFCGDSVKSISLDDRLALSNMMVQAGAFSVFFNTTKAGSLSDSIEIDLAKVRCAVKKPDTVLHNKTDNRSSCIYVDQAFVGGCASGRISDLRIAAKIMKGKIVKDGVKFYIAPLTKKIYLQALKEGLIKTLSKSGAIILPPGCGPCAGTHQGVLADGQVAVASCGRNFSGSMGNKSSSVYLLSTARVAAIALSGKLSN